MPSRQRLHRGSGAPAGARLQRFWLPLFVIATAVFAGSLVALAIVIRNAASDGGATAASPPETAVTQGSQPSSPAGTGSPEKEPSPTRTPAPTRKPSPTRLPSPTPEATVQPGRSPAEREDPDLVRAIEDALGDDKQNTSVVVRRLTDGRSASVDGERVFYAASTFKLAVLYESERARTAGELNLNDQIQLSEADLAEDLGTASELPIDEDGRITVRAALEAMITLSDNATANALLHLLGGDAIDRALNGIGLTQTSVNTHELPTTARDMAALMQALWEGRGLSAQARNELRGFLVDQHTRDGIPAGLPGNVNVGNKTGTWDNATHDIAFVDAPGGTYIIAILSDQGWKWEPLRRVSSAVYTAMTSAR